MELVIDGRREQLAESGYPAIFTERVMGRRLTAASDQTPGKGGPDGAVAVISRAYWQHHDSAAEPAYGRISQSGGAVTDCWDHAIGNHVGGTGASVRHGSCHDTFRDPAKMSGTSRIVVGLKPGVSAEQARGSQRPVQGVHDGRTGLAGGRGQSSITWRWPTTRGLGVLPVQFQQPLTALLVLAGLAMLAACVRKCGEPDAGAGGGAIKGLGSPPGDWSRSAGLSGRL